VSSSTSALTATSVGPLAQLLAQLEATGAKISASPIAQEKQNWLLWTLANFGPLLFYVFLFRYLMSSMEE
jgi:hypothetical protein